MPHPYLQDWLVEAHDRRDEFEDARVIVVVGMHRSGTSLVTRGLSALGVPLGDNVLSQFAPDNEKGHWEDIDVREFNERMMASLAVQWDVVGTGDEAAMGAASLMPLVEEGKALVRSKLSGRRLWAFKDPRIGRLWPFWQRVLVGDRGWGVDFVWSLRHPVSVARSLRHRNGFGSLKSHLLWMHHNRAPYGDIAANRHVVVDYDRMLMQPREELVRMAASLELGATSGDSVDAFVDEFVDPELRHFDRWDEGGDRRVSIGVEHAACAAYEALRSVATDADSLRGAAFRAEWDDAYGELAKFVDSAFRVDVSTLAERGLHEAEARIERELQERQAEGISELQGQVTETLQEQFASLSGRIDETESRLRREQQEGHTAGLAGLQEQVSGTLQEQFTALSGRIEESEGRLRREQQESQTAGLARLQEQVSGTLQEQFTALSGRIEESEGRLRSEQQESGSAGLARLQEQVTGTLQEQFTALSGRIDEAESRLRSEQQESGSAGLARLQEQVTGTLREQFAVLSGRIDEVQSRWMQTRQELALLNDLLNKERYTVVKPLLRRGYRLGVAIVRRMPGPVERQLRRLKQRLLPASVALTVDVVHADTPRAPGTGSRPAVDLGQPLAGRHDVLVFPVIDWHFRFQRPQQLARQLAERGHRIFYLSTTFHSADEPTFQVIESPAPNVFLVTICIPGKQPLIYQDPMSDEQRERLAAAVGDLVTTGGLRNTIAMVDLPFWRRLVESVPGFLTVYDCMDYHGGFSTNSPVMTEEEDRLIASADLVITSSAGLSDLVGRSRENVLVRNAGEIAYFRETPPKLAYESGRPVAGYLGAIAEWFDMELVASAARRFPDWDFVLVGSTDYGDVSKVRKIDNVKLIGEVPYAEAASWVHSFDVALIPFQLTELTLCTNPVKVYEYLAAGRPVVATALPEVKLMDDVVHVAADHARFMDLLGVAMGESGDRARAQERTQWALAHDWSDRADRLQDSIGEAFPRVSVIVLTWNNLEFTQACLHSLEVHTQYPNWELLLVDNASTDGTQEFLADYAERNPRSRLIQNEGNLGFAAGNNRGLEAADGEYLVILNNDTYVTRGWLLDLTRHMRRDPKLGLVGPVTNNIGNEARIAIDYADMDKMQRAAVAYTSKHAREELDVRVVAFFCAAMPRSVYERVGGLDERFGLGFFEDDDYCRKVEQASFRIAIAEDVFVHHHLSASFDKLDDEKKQELFDRNKVLYEEKWGTWQPHKYRD